MALWELYAGGGLSKRATSLMGSNLAVRTVEFHNIRRRKLLKSNLSSGLIKPADLSESDIQLLGPEIKSGLIHIPHADGGGHGKSFFGLLGHLGEDIFNFGKNLVPGIVEAGKAFVHDVGTGETIFKNGLHLNPKSELEKKIVDPTLKQYKATYGKGGGSFWENFYKHPLGPLLDVATVASGGAGAAGKAGQLALKAGARGTLARKAASIRSLTRDPVVGMLDNDSVEVPRRFSNRPLVKGSQILFDKVEARSKTIHRLYGASAARRYLNKTHNQLQLQIAQAIRGATRPLEDSYEDLSPKESVALHLAIRGINTRNRIQNFQLLMRNSLEGKNPKGYNITDEAFADLDRKHVERLANLDDETIHYALNPTARMVDAAETWDRDVTAHRPELGVDEATQQESKIAHQRILQELQDQNGMFGSDEHPIQARERQEKIAPELSEPSVPENYPIAPNYVPNRSIQGLQWYEPPSGLIRGQIAKLGRYSEPGLIRRKREDRVQTEVDKDNILAPRGISATHHSTGATFTSGAFRVDSHVFLEHVRARERVLRDNVWKRDRLNQFAAKAEDEHGEYKIQKFKTGDDMRHALGEGWVLVNPDFVYSTWRKERNMVEDVQRRANHLIDDGILPDDPEFNATLDKLASDHAENFVRLEQGMMRRPGVAIPIKVFRHIKALQKVSDDFTNPVMRAYTRFIRAWRSATLTFMPRWALNTAVGTFLQTLVSGHGLDARNYMLAYRARPAARGPVGRRIEKIADHLGVGKFDPEGWLPEGTMLGHQAVAEDFGELRNHPGLFEKIIGARMPTRQVLEGVQGIEDYFRSVMMMGALRKEGREDVMNMDVFEGPERERALDDMGDEIKQYWKANVPDHEYVDWLLKDKDRVDRALEEVNRFGYNYAHLGPGERRYIRQFIPFWGWYRFITKLTWRLPVEYPGRSEVMSFLSNAGQEKFDELGDVPDWLRGSIILNFRGGNLKYLSGMGLNPFSQFANPLAPHGAVNGLLELGQFSPVIQSAMLAYGLDPLTGDSVRISPQEGVSRDIMGRLIDVQTGQQVSPATKGQLGLKRLVMGLARSFPEFRIGEKQILNKGDTPYPESIPYLAPRPMGTKYKGKGLEGVGAVAASSTGIIPRYYDVGAYQDLQKAMLKYAQSRNKSDLKRLRKNLTARALARPQK